jgi:hypothetical protein
MARIMIRCRINKGTKVNIRVVSSVSLVMCVLLTGCASERATGGAERTEARTTEEVDGVVLEILNTGRYKYIKVKTEDETNWVATTRCSAKV